MDNDTRSHPRKSLHTLAIAALIDGIVAAIAMIAIGSFVKLSKDLSPVVTLSPDGTFVGLVICLILALGPLQRALGGAAFNPCDVAVAMSMGKATRKEFCVRVVGQAIGGALGASYTLRLFPPEWQQGLSGLAPALRAPLASGAACEFALTYLLNFGILASQDVPSRWVRFWLPLVAIATAIRVGTPSGPALNPVAALSWSAAFPGSGASGGALAQVLVYWAAPLAAAVLAGWTYIGFRVIMREKQD